MTKTLKLYFVLGDGLVDLDGVEVYADITAVVRQINNKLEYIGFHTHGLIEVNGVGKTFKQFQASRPYTSELFLKRIETNALERALKASDTAWEVEVSSEQT